MVDQEREYEIAYCYTLTKELKETIMLTKKMKRKGRFSFVKTVLAIAAFALVTCCFSGAALADKRNNSVIIAMNQEPMQFNPLIYENAGTESVPESCMFDALWDVRPSGDFVPNLAVRVPTKDNGGVSEDGLTWKIELKRDVRWQDGKPFTAADVEFTYKSIINPKVNVARDRYGFQFIKDFKVIDDYHIEYTLKEPYGPMYWSWQHIHIVPKHVLSKVKDINTAKWNINPFGTGPYKLVKRVPGSHMVYKRNPDYHQGPPRIETVIHKFITDQTVAYTQLVSGEIDYLGLMGVPPERFAEAKKLKHVDVRLEPEATTENIIINNKKSYFKDKRVRQALYMAVDTEKVIRDVRYNTVIRTLTYIPADHWAYNQNLKDPGYNPEKAGKLLDEAGWKMGPDGIREKDGKKLSFLFSVTTGDKSREQAQLIFHQNLRAIGMDVTIKNLVPSVMWGDFFFKGQFDIIFGAAPLRLGTDPDYSKEFFMAKEKFGCFEGNDEMVRLAKQGSTTIGQNARKKIYDRFEELWLDETCFAPLFTVGRIYANKKGLGGYKVNPYNTDVTDFIQEWYWK
jgi:peptide/nickel transport system substrate-binding protein